MKKIILIFILILLSGCGSGGGGSSSSGDAQANTTDTTTLEVVKARGTKSTLDERLDVVLNEDGTLNKSTTTVLKGIDVYRYFESDPGNNGIHYLSCPSGYNIISVGCDCFTGGAGYIMEQDISSTGTGWCVCSATNKAVTITILCGISTTASVVLASPTDNEAVKEEKIALRNSMILSQPYP